MDLRLVLGGFIRPFGTAGFIIEFLKGNGPENSKQIDPDIGAPMTDIHFEYKSALHQAYARHAAEREEERRIRKGRTAFTEKEYAERLQYFLSRIPYKLHKMRICELHQILWSPEKAGLGYRNWPDRAISDPGQLPSGTTPGILPPH